MVATFSPNAVNLVVSILIKDEELLEKTKRGEGLTVEEVKRYQEERPAYLHKVDEQAEDL